MRYHVCGSFSFAPHIRWPLQARKDAKGVPKYIFEVQCPLPGVCHVVRAPALPCPDSSRRVSTHLQACKGAAPKPSGSSALPPTPEALGAEIR
jgi:hypothetical protein